MIEDENIKKISKLITEDPDIFNEMSDEVPLDDDFDDDDDDKVPLDDDDDPYEEIVKHLRSMLTPEEQREAEFEEEKARNRAKKAFQRSMEAPYKPPPVMDCQKAREHEAEAMKQASIDSDYNYTDSDEKIAAWDHLDNCKKCKLFRLFGHDDVDLSKFRSLDDDDNL